jgi:hypothetical protein
MWLTISGFVACSCNRYPHTNIYDPAVSGSIYEVILWVSDDSLREDIPDIATRYFRFWPIIQNTGSYTADDVNASISETDPTVRISGYTELSYPPLEPGQSSVPYLWEGAPYYFYLAIPIGALTPINCEIFVEITEASHGPWFDTLQVVLQ